MKKESEKTMRNKPKPTNVCVPKEVKAKVAMYAKTCGVSVTMLVGEILSDGLTDTTKNSIMNKKADEALAKEDAIIQNAEEKKKAILDEKAKRLKLKKVA
jgi:hypothetical protein|tara:strand:+ start:129 stop:428 length:300 start_codon:yes stop_codon:yes gene_type:complete